MAKRYKIQLYSVNGAIIQSTGGVCQVCTAGDAAKATITNKAGASLSNPVTLSNGEVEFYTANSISSVDIYMMAPGGQFIIRRGIKPGETGDIFVDVDQPHQCAVIPLSADDDGFTAASEIDTGFDMPDDAVVLPQGVGFDITTLDDTEDMDVGLLSSESGGDADGFIVQITTDAAVLVLATLADGAATLGALLKVDESAGDLVPEAHRIDGTAVSITYTPTTGSDTIEGFIKLPYMLNL